MKKSVKILCALLAIAIVLSAGGYAGSIFGYFNKGNYGKYSINNSPVIESELNGKTIIFLGSSVTAGYGAKFKSFTDYMAKQDKIVAVVQAKSGTTLVDDKPTSYVSRMKKIDKNIKADAFICQLSTNDAKEKDAKPLGKVSDGFDINTFDTMTVAGAMEYIIAYAKQTWNCPVIFYTGTKYDNANYAEMVSLLNELQKKWDIGVIDLWNNDDMYNISDSDYKLYMNDSIHPTRAGYRDWWLPVMRDYLINYLKVK